MKVIRVLIYEGTPAEIVTQLSNSVADGVRRTTGMSTMTVITVSELQLQMIQQALGYLEKDASAYPGMRSPMKEDQS